MPWPTVRSPRTRRVLVADTWLLRSVGVPAPDEVRDRTRRARYTAGTSAESGEPVPDYVAEEGVEADRMTETFAEVVLEIDNWRWQGTRFRLRTGKAMTKRCKEVVVHSRPVPPLPFADAADELAPNQLVIGIDGPYGLTLRLTGVTAGPSSHLAPLALGADLGTPDLPTYGRVLMDALSGDSRLSIRGDEAEQSWRILTPVLQGWADGLVPLEEYVAGKGIDG